MSEPAAAPPQSPPPPRRRIVHNVVFSLLTRLQGGVFTYVTTRLLLKGLQVDEYGLYALFFTGAMGTISTLSQFGLSTLLVRFVPEYFWQSKYRMIGKLFRASVLVQAIFAGVLLLVAMILAPWIAEWIHFSRGANLIRVFALGIFAYLLAEKYRSLLSGLFLQRGIFQRTLAYNIVRVGAIFLAIHTSDPFAAVMVAEAALYGVSLLLFYWAERRLVRPLVKADSSEDETPPWKRFRRYAVFGYVNDAGALLLSTVTDLFFVTGFLGTSVVALYALAGRVLGMAYHFLPISYLTEVITPLFFSEYGASRERARFGFTLLTKFSLLLTIPLGVWLAIMGRSIIVEFFDPRYADAAYILAITALFMPLETMRYPLALVLQNAERNDVLIYGKIFGLLKIGAALWLLPRTGFTTMALITSLSVTSQNVLLYLWIAIKLKSGTDLKGILRIVVNGAAAGLVLLLMMPLFKGIVGVILSAVVFGVVYFGLCLIHRAFRPEERDFLNQKLPYRIWKF
jgi:O-antigen/teichoic acid export membrane protein